VSGPPQFLGRGSGTHYLLVFESEMLPGFLARVVALMPACLPSSRSEQSRSRVETGTFGPDADQLRRSPSAGRKGKWVAPSSGCQPCEQPVDGGWGTATGDEDSDSMSKGSRDARELVPSLEHALTSA
jgi:hypothetical protein